MPATGTVSSGTDVSGVFGHGANYTFSSDPFTLTYTFDTTKGTETPSCTVSGSTTTCVSEITGTGATTSPGTATLTINSHTYTFGANGSDSTNHSTAIIEIPGTTFSSSLQVTDNTANDSVSVALSSSSSSITNFDWRTGFNSSFLSAASTKVAPFAISNGSNHASGALNVTGLSESGFSCSASAPTVFIHTLLEPNILVLDNSTTVVATISGATTWYPISLSYVDGGIHGFELPTAMVATSDGTDATGTLSYQSEGDQVNEQITATACTNAADPYPIYDFNLWLDDPDDTTYLNLQQSQVDDTAYNNDTDLSAANIETMLRSNSLVSGGSFLAAFYLNDNGNGGWILPTTTGAATNTYNSGTDTAYCGGACPTSGDTGKYVATYIAQAASTSGINPKLLLVKLQVESSLVSSVSIPSDSLLNFAFGLRN